MYLYIYTYTNVVYYGRATEIKVRLVTYAALPRAAPRHATPRHKMPFGSM